MQRNNTRSPPGNPCASTDTDFELSEWVVGNTSTTYLAVQSGAVFDYEDAGNPMHVLGVSVKTTDPTGRFITTYIQVTLISLAHLLTAHGMRCCLCVGQT